MKEVTGTDVQRMSLPRYLPVFLQRNLSVRYNVTEATISRWVASHKIPSQDVFDASGRPLGWTWTAISILESNDPELLALFQAHQVIPAVGVMSDP